MTAIVGTHPDFASIAEGDAIPPVSLHLTYTKVALIPMATWDLFPGHHDPAYAHSQGQKDIYLNTGIFQGFADRVVTDWSGPATFIARRKITMVGSVYPGDTLTGSGRVKRKYVEAGKAKVDLDVELTTEKGRAVMVETTIILPS